MYDVYEMSVSWANGYYRRDYVKGNNFGEGMENAYKLVRAYIETGTSPVRATITDHKDGQMYSVMIDGKLI